MAGKWNYENVKYFIEVESDTGCKLLSSSLFSTKDKITVECACKEAFEVTFERFIWSNKRQCNTCSLKAKSEKRRKTKDQFIDEIKQLCGDEYILIGDFTSYSDNIKIQHTKCCRIWDTTPTSIIARIKKGGGCSECSYKREGNRRTKTNNEFKAEVTALVGDEYVFLEEYKKANVPIKIRHNICKSEYMITPNSFLGGSRCRKCSHIRLGMNQRKDRNVFKDEVFNLVGDEYEFLEEYIKNNHKLKIKHHVCGFVYKVTPADFLAGYRCPSCNSSKGEKKIAEILKRFNLDYKIQKSFSGCRTKRTLPFDFWVEDKILIEYDGEFHFEVARFSKDKNKMLKKMRTTQNNDRIKNQYCIEHDIPLIRIPYWELKRAEEILIILLEGFGLIKSFTKVNYYNDVNKYIVDNNWDHDKYISSKLSEKEAI